LVIHERRLLAGNDITDGQGYGMAEVISLDRHRAVRRARAESHGAGAVEGDRRGIGPNTRPVTFYFDLASPFTYLAVERVHRMLPLARWEPAFGESLRRRDPWSDPRARDAAERRAAALRVPLVWPERPVEEARVAMRAVSFAATCKRAAPFAIAAARLAFCGGFDLDDPELIAEASAAAGLPLEECITAAYDERRDAMIAEAGKRLLAAGADRLPTLSVAGRVFAGEQRIAEAVAAATAPARRRRVPFAG
jgi:2-hydroxychromene-2-carboxylate isomerase